MKSGHFVHRWGRKMLCMDVFTYNCLISIYLKDMQLCSAIKTVKMMQNEPFRGPFLHFFGQNLAFWGEVWIWSANKVFKQVGKVEEFALVERFLHFRQGNR